MAPTAVDSATIDRTGSYSVTISGADTVGSLLVTDPGATVSINANANLAVTGTLTLSAGSLNLSGTLSGGTIVSSGGTIVWSGGTLSGVSYDGTLNLSSTSSYVYITNGLTLAGASGTGLGTINLTGQSTYIYAEGGQTINNATLNIGNSNGYDYLYNYDPYGIAVLTLGASLTINQVGTYAILDTSYYGRSASGIVNAGTINAGLSGGNFTIQGSGSFTNQGTINVSNGTLSLTSSSWSNSGTIAVTGGTLDLQGNGLTLAQLGTVTHSGGVVNLQTTLNDTGTTLNVGTGTGLGTLTLATSGTIENGTIVDQGSGLAFAGGTLSGVSYDGTLNLSSTSSYVYITNGLTLAGASGTGLGTINLTGQSAQIYAEGGQTINNATLNIGNSNGYDYLYNYDPYGIAVLTLGASLTINQVGTYAILDTSYYGRSASGIVNAGTINAGLSGGSFTIQGSGSFTNQGTINVSNGTLSLTSSSWSNSGTIAVTGGTLDLQGNGLTLAQLGTVTHSGGVVNLQTTLNDTGTTLSVGTGTGLGTLTLATSGTIENGTIVDQGSGLAFAGGTLSGVSYDGTLNLSSTSSYVYITNGLTLAGASGTGLGTINLTGQSAQIYAEGGQTINNATLNIGNSSNYDYLYNYDPYGIAVLTLGASLTINQVGTYAILDTSNYGRSASGIVNAGTINAGLSGGNFTIQGSGSFTNQGTINVSNGTLSLTSSSWSNSGTIAVTGGTLDLQGNGLTLAQLGTVTHSGGVVNLQTTLNDTGTTLNVGTGTGLGTLTLATSGTIENGTIVDQGSGLAFAGGTLSGVSYDGTLNLSSTSSYVYITNGLTLAGASGTGLGTINLTGQSTDIYAEGGQTINNATLNIGNSNGYDYLYNYDPYGIAVLTLGASLTINQVGTYAILDTSYYGRSASGIVNAGTINAGLSGGNFTIQGSGSFTNQGTINVSNGTLSLTSSSWSNSGTIAVTGGTLDLQGNGLTLAQLGTVTHSGGVVNLQTTLNDTGTTLNVGTGTGLGTLTLATSGTIENGTIVDQGSGLAFAGGTLSGVSYDGTLNLSSTSSYVYITNGLTLAGASGTGLGTINLTGQSAQIYAEGGQTINNATLNIGNSSNYDYLYNYDPYGIAVLTLGASLTINQVGTYAILDTSYYGRSASGIVNAGTINAGLSGGNFTIQGSGSFTNQGTINVSNGDILTISAASFIDIGSLVANGGNITIAANATGGTATIYGTSQIQYNAASNEDVTFVSPSSAFGELILLHSAAFTGTIAGFTGTAPTPSTSDKLDLRDINFSSTQFSTSYANNVLTVTDGTHTADINFAGSYTLANFHFASDGSGGTLVTDPPAISDQSGATGSAATAPTNTTEGLNVTSVTTPAPVAGDATHEGSKLPSEMVTSGKETGPLTLDHESSFTEQISKFAPLTTPGTTLSGTINSENIIHQDLAGLSQIFHSSIGSSAGFRFNESNSTTNFASSSHYGGKSSTDTSAEIVQGADRTGQIDGDQFVFRPTLGSEGATSNHFYPSQPNACPERAAVSAEDRCNAWTENRTAVIGEDSRHDIMQLKDVTLAHLHANDFILPSH